MAAGFQYPASDLDKPDTLLALLGSFWANTYAGSALVSQLVHARAQLDAQAHLSFLELLASISRFTVPIWHTDNWYFLELTESAQQQAPINRARYGDDDLAYAADSGTVYGGPASTVTFAWPAPDALVDGKLILNRISDPSLTLTRGIDFELRDESIIFRANPFADERVATQAVFEGNTQVDRLCGLWLYRGQFDFATMYRQFGYVIAAQARSSLAYRRFVNAVYDGLVDGPTQKALEECWAAMADAPLAEVNGETVETVVADTRYRWVITEHQAYRCNLDATVLVAAGDVLQAGQALTDAVTFYEFNRGQTPDAAEIKALAMGRGLLASGYFGELVFENKTVPLTVTEDVDGYTKVEFALRGWPGDITQFWDDVHAAGVAANETLAMLLDQRPADARDTQPTAAALPITINPLGFLCANVLRHHVSVVVLRPNSFGSDALGTTHGRHLRRLIPPHTVMLVVVALALDREELIMEGPGDDTTPGYAETLNTYIGLNLNETLDPAVMISEQLRTRQLGGRCV